MECTIIYSVSLSIAKPLKYPSCRDGLMGNSPNVRGVKIWRLAPSQWETSLQNNDVSHWLGAKWNRSYLIQVMACFSPWCLAIIQTQITKTLRSTSIRPWSTWQCWISVYSLMNLWSLLSGMQCWNTVNLNTRNKLKRSWDKSIEKNIFNKTVGIKMYFTPNVLKCILHNLIIHRGKIIYDWVHTLLAEYWIPSRI